MTLGVYAAEVRARKEIVLEKGEGSMAENESATVVAKKPRMANLELLRGIAMMMVIVLHYLSKGDLLGDLTADHLSYMSIAAWVLEVFCLVAVNVYMLISGYFLSTSSFKLSRLLQLWLQVWMYSVVVGLIAAFTGILPAEECDTHYFLTLLFPISMDHYWFMTAYVFLYLLLPILSMAVRKMTKGQMQVALAGLLTMFCLLKSVLPFRLEADGQGYDCIWYLCVFMTAAYIKKFGLPFLEKKKNSIILYVAGCMGIFAETLCLRQIYLKTGSMGLIMKIGTEYNHVFVFLASVGLFMTFLSIQVPVRASKWINGIAPYTLGVYLLHENMGVRYAWQDLFGAHCIYAMYGLVWYTFVAVAVVFIVGIAVDWLRSRLVKELHVLLSKWKWYRKLTDRIVLADTFFAQQ